MSPGQISMPPLKTSGVLSVAFLFCSSLFVLVWAGLTVHMPRGLERYYTTPAIGCQSVCAGLLRLRSPLLV
ncbi:hypothetical protein SERLADRAFT_480543 [Serpula lacrymans var. lacrymans S7.9]|uniref:Uncharacterized protein n=1 Tax=Serpula lacrymans var. lacrymans (strain S7.9) TaxID=578457 RepID=F8PDQ2_SERL9|nr:uncharacterized protein SERLADRAFT_480543 [Serpula lacrymans var. lacrymans S7.9]EGO18872.1 hypothetical protein SERLADRAFT_480543 [Serpula lacrymans var. lacrymans S7.9]